MKGKYEHSKRILLDIIALSAVESDIGLHAALQLARLHVDEGDVAQSLARRRYLAANGTYERFGLGLRVPLVTSKLKALG